MNEIGSNPITKNNNNSNRLKDIYSKYVRPKTGSLLRILNLDIHYKSGFGDYLYFDKDDKEIKVLDMTGGYGANLLGHKNKKLNSTLIESLTNSSPSCTQASLRKNSALLGKKVSEILENETKKGPYISTILNTGTEAVEAATKLSLMHRNQLKHDLESKNIFQKNYFTKLIKNFSNSEKDYFFKKICTETGFSANEISELPELIYQFNQKQLDKNKVFLSVENSYHGKTLGSLSLSSSEKYKAPFVGKSNSLKTIFINSATDLEKLHNEYSISLLFFDQTKLALEKIVFSLIAGVIIEPVQGEGGIYELSENFLINLRQFTKKFNILFISDEIQAGLYRHSGFASLSKYNIQADIYTFSKGLGGGVAKISMMTCHHESYPEGFDYLHTSTFAEDDLSSSIALEVLNILEEDQNNFKEVELRKSLTNLKEKYPHIIQDVRGNGYMVGIEFSRESAMRCHEFMVFDQVDFLGYFYSAALLHNENIRIAPSLSNSRTLRLEPSLYFSKNDLSLLLNGLENFLKALDTLKMEYFLGHIYPSDKIIDTFEFPKAHYSLEKNNLRKAVFFVHMIDNNHAKSLIQSHKHVSDSTFDKKISKISEILDFTLLFRGTLHTIKNEPIELIFMTHPMRSKEMIKSFKLNKQNKIVDKLQRGIDFMKELGATTIGLGQFTSIISGNGLMLNPRGMNITTGNAYTTALTFRATLKAAESKKISLPDSHVACIGMAGNILSVTASLIADHIKSMTMIYHTDLDKSKKYQETLKIFFLECIKSEKESPFNISCKKAFKYYDFIKDKDQFFPYVKSLEENNTIILKNESTDLKEADIVITGTSSPKPFIDASACKKNSVVVDVGVPQNVIPASLELRSDISYIQGGMAKLPLHNGDVQIIDTSAFTPEQGTTHACLAETIILTMADKKNFSNTGRLSKDMIFEIEKIALEQGFSLANFKISKSF